MAADNLMTVNMNNTIVREADLHLSNKLLGIQRKLYFIGLLLDIPYLFRYIIGIEQVLSAKLLGVTFCSNLKFDDHIKTF